MWSPSAARASRSIPTAACRPTWSSGCGRTAAAPAGEGGASSSACRAIRSPPASAGSRAGARSPTWRPPVFRDVVTGSNGAFVAGPGFDLASGWGAPLVDALAGALDGPGPCEPDLVCMVPSGRGGHSCAGEWLVEQELFLVRRNRLPAPRQTCRDGDPQCDADGAADGHCTLRVALCLNVFDSRGTQPDARGPVRPRVTLGCTP